MQISVNITITGDETELFQKVADLLNGASHVKALNVTQVNDHTRAVPKNLRAPDAAIEIEEVKDAPAKGKRGPKPKAKAVVIEEEDEDESDEEIEEEDEDEEEEDEVEEAPAPVKRRGKTAEELQLTLDEDIIPAFKKYGAKHGRPAAAAILRKFKVATTLELKPAQFKDVMKALKAGA